MPRDAITVTSADPAAGSEITYTNTAGAGNVYELYAIYFQLVTDATVANRRVGVIIDDGTNTVFKTVCGTDQTASQTVDYSACPGQSGAQTISGLSAVLVIPQLTILPGWRVRTTTSGIVAGDNYGPMRLLVSPR